MIIRLFSFYILLIFIFSCAYNPKAKDIRVENINTHCDCVNSMLLVVSELNVIYQENEDKTSKSNSKSKKNLEKIMSMIDDKCIVFEGEDEKLKVCDQYDFLINEMETYYSYNKEF